MTQLVYCRICAEPSSIGAKFCQACWALLDFPLNSEGLADNLRRRLSGRRYRARLFRLGMFFAAIIGIVFYVWDEIQNDLVPLPTTRIEVVTGADSWGLSGGNLQHSVSVPNDVPLDGKILWSFKNPEGFNSSPVVSDGIVYQATLDAKVLALNASDGEILWEYSASGPVDATPALTLDTLYVGFRDGTFVALNREDGSVLWDYHYPAVVSASPIVYRGITYVGFGDGVLVALDAHTGYELWSFRAGREGGRKEGHQGEWIIGSPVVNDNVMAIASLNGSIHFIDIRTGLRRLKFDAVDPITSNIAFINDRLVLTTQLGQLIVLDSTKLDYPPEETVRIWRKQWFHWGFQSSPPIPKGFIWGVHRSVKFSSPAVADDMVYVLADDGWLHCLDLETGASVWNYNAGASSRNGAPIVLGSEVLFGTDDGNVHAVERYSGTGEVIFTLSGPINEAPVIADGKMYVATGDGVLSSIR